MDNDIMGVDPEFFADDFNDMDDFSEETIDNYEDSIDVETDISNMSWEELATSLGFAEEMLNSERRKRISVSEYKSKNVNTKRNIPRNDLRPFERYVNGKIAMIAQMEAGKPHPIEALITKMEIAEISYSDIRKALLTSKAALQSDYIPEDINFLNLNICIDIISLLNGCVFLDTTDIAYVLLNNVEEVYTPQMRMIKKWL